MSALKDMAEKAQLEIIRNYILASVQKGHTRIELFDYWPGEGGGYVSIFGFPVTLTQMETLAKEMGFSFSTIQEIETEGVLFWKRTLWTHNFYTVIVG